MDRKLFQVGSGHAEDLGRRTALAFKRVIDGFRTRKRLAERLHKAAKVRRILE